MNSPIKNQVNTIFVSVSELHRSVKWYCDLLGQKYQAEHLNQPVYKLDINHHTGLILDAGPRGKVQKVTPSPHPLYNTDDIQAAFRFVEKPNYQITSPITVFTAVKDPDENIIMVCNG
ncbi:VOC family protein [Virgibacillus salarius]|uniref:VOC family protein n=1 Tax=Virgibacillus salarius TaxID=447199 RepID=UPI002491D92F|nr:VOC family protein [Virgibacillus salarius]WBX81703.1 VOC family protein [Virgibacillus salarius]